MGQGSQGGRAHKSRGLGVFSRGAAGWGVGRKHGEEPVLWGVIFLFGGVGDVDGVECGGVCGRGVCRVVGSGFVDTHMPFSTGEEN